MSKKKKFTVGSEQADDVVDSFKAEQERAKEEKRDAFGHTEAEREEMSRRAANEIWETINELTPVYSVFFYMSDKPDERIHFANFYGATIPFSKTPRPDDAGIKAEIQKLCELIDEKQKKEGLYLDITDELFTQINYAQFGGFMHKRIAEMEDASACKTAEGAMQRFQRAYTEEHNRRAGKATGLFASILSHPILHEDIEDEELEGTDEAEPDEKAILAERLAQYKRDLDAVDQLLGTSETTESKCAYKPIKTDKTVD